MSGSSSRPSLFRVDVSSSHPSLSLPYPGYKPVGVAIRAVLARQTQIDQLTHGLLGKRTCIDTRLSLTYANFDHVLLRYCFCTASNSTETLQLTLTAYRPGCILRFFSTTRLYHRRRLGQLKTCCHTVM
ncbi:hypothetical protein ElyMa_005288200 [Elysia marginata]|uniref:Uncharacterized protein n=1 Tax=Elysia marginata TaxID=1093978 RepID=A0AAV4K367_9GAST|nr:hypothetical protein ElyMa_005288200 [Elysia marginata]